jgi:membrane dipeptidase
MSDSITQATSQFLSSHLVWDNHACMPLRPFDDSFLPQLDRYQRSKVNVVSLNIGFGEMTIEEHIRVIAHFRRWISLHSDKYLLVERVADIERAVREGKLAVTFDIEGMRAIGDQPSLIGLYYDLGVRWMSMAYNRANLVACGCHDEVDTGLTKFGRQVLDEMARVGMVMCCSHTGPRTTMDVIEYAHNPVIFSHSNPKALKDHPRNITDEAMRACAATGGVVGINGVGIFLGNGDIATETIVRHIDYVAQLIGPDHVGIALDYVFDMEELAGWLKQQHTYPADGNYDVQQKFVAPEQIPEIAEALLRRGYRESDLAKIMGGNHLRIANQVWK